MDQPKSRFLSNQFSLRQVSGIEYLNKMSTYHLACGDNEITKVRFMLIPRNYVGFAILPDRNRTLSFFS